MMNSALAVGYGYGIETATAVDMTMRNQHELRWEEGKKASRALDDALRRHTIVLLVPLCIFSHPRGLGC